MPSHLTVDASFVYNTTPANAKNDIMIDVLYEAAKSQASAVSVCGITDHDRLIAVTRIETECSP